jgi:hypothetical protein
MGSLMRRARSREDACDGAFAEKLPWIESGFHEDCNHSDSSDLMRQARLSRAYDDPQRSVVEDPHDAFTRTHHVAACDYVAWAQELMSLSAFTSLRHQRA